MTSYRNILLVGAVLFGIAGSAQAAGDITIVRDLATRVGPVPDRAAAARHRRKGNPLRHRRPVLRFGPRAGTPDEARNRNRLQPDQRFRRRGRTDAETVRRRRRLRALAYARRHEAAL